MLKQLGIVALAFLVLAPSARPSAVAGHDYMVLGVPQRQETNGKIEVIEFFSWGCPHCYEFYPMLARWMATLPSGRLPKLRLPGLTLNRGAGWATACP